MSAAAIAIHALAAIIWVGGMFFAYVVLRPAIGALEPAGERLRLWSRVFPKFFVWVWAAVVALPATGYWRVLADFGGFGAAGLHVNVMHGLGLLMIFLFLYLYSGPYQRFQIAVAAEDWPEAGQNLNTIRRVIAINLALGLTASVLGASGRLWG